MYVYFDADEQTYLRYAEGTVHEPRRGGGASAVYVGLVDEQGYPGTPKRSSTSSTTKSMQRLERSVRVPRSRTLRAATRRASSCACASSVGEDHGEGVLIEDRAVGTDLSKKFVLDR